MSKVEKAVMMDSPEAARRMTVTGWVSRDGRFFGEDERTARYAGCTHRTCEACGGSVEKSWIKCPACRAKDMDAKWAKLERRPWDGVTPLAIFDSDTYFFDLDDIENYCEDNGVEVGSLRLVFCRPVKPRPVSANELFLDELPEDGDVEDADVLAAVEALNKALEKAEPFSWLPGSVAAVVVPLCSTPPCPLDTDGDGNCQRHRDCAAGVLREEP